MAEDNMICRINFQAEKILSIDAEKKVNAARHCLIRHNIYRESNVVEPILKPDREINKSAGVTDATYTMKTDG
jgi:hypothetical protein